MSGRGKERRRPWWRRAIKGLLLLVMAAVLFCYGIVVVSLSLLTPDRLTPLAAHVATGFLQNCEVQMSRVQIGLRDTYPYFHLEVDSLRIISTTMRDLDRTVYADVPAYADTLLCIDGFSGGINVPALMKGSLDFSDLTIDGPTANIVIVNDSLFNFNIVPPSEEKETEPFNFADIPTIKIHKLALRNPGPLRYDDCATDTHVEVSLDEVSVDGTGSPLYRLRFNGDVRTPLLFDYLAVEQMRFGLNGDISWSQTHPYAVGVDNFAFEADVLRGRLGAHVDFSDNLVVDRFMLDLDPVPVKRLLAVLPPDAGVPEGIETDAVVKADVKLLEPFDAGVALLPHVSVNISIPDTRLDWRDLHLRNLSLDLGITVPDDELRNIKVEVRNLNLRGPATDLTFKGWADRLTTDPRFNVTMTGRCDFSRLPQQLVNLVPGTLSGAMRADATVSGTMSMLNLKNFQKLKVDGKIAFADLGWESPDTITMLYGRRVDFDFGTDRYNVDSLGNRSERLLMTTLKIDSLFVFHDVLKINLTDFAIGLGASNTGALPDSGRIVPLGGGVKFGSFSLLSLADSARVRVRNASGRAVISLHNGNLKQPQFSANLSLGRVVAGDRTTRVSLRNASTEITAWREPQGRRARELTAIYDSLRHDHPHLSPDSLIADALAIHARKHPRRKRDHLEMTPDSTELIAWQTDNSIKKVLLGWAIRGKLQSNRATFFSPYFPLRNSISEVDLTFNNDSVNVNGLRYRAGNSDFAMKGYISNVRQALTSSTGRVPLKVRFGLVSDTIDVNRLAEAAFRGSAYAQATDSVKALVSLGDDDDDDEAMERAMTGAADATGDDGHIAFLVPTNIDAELTFKANNIRYSDLLLQKFTGQLLASGGALNVHNLNASSDVGGVNLSALYMGRDPNDLKFGFGLKVNKFNIHRFLRLVPAVDSVMPLLRNFEGVISADMAATTSLKPDMDFDLSTLDAAISIEGDSLVLIDPDTFKMLSKWLFFKDKNRNIIDHMSVQMLIDDNEMQLFPFIFNIDRYRLGVQGYNDFDMNFDYHIAVLKSPIPFKFGINISGNPDKYKIRLGGAKFDDKTPLNVALVDNTRVNLVREIEDVFRRGVRSSDFGSIGRGIATEGDGARRRRRQESDTLSATDSAMFIKEGLIDAPVLPDSTATAGGSKRKGKKKK